MCEDCHLSCESCSGEEKNQCTKCAKGLSLTYVDNDYSRLYLYALRPAKFHIFVVAYIQLFCSDDVYSFFLFKGGFWPHSKHVCQSVRGVSLPVGWALCVRPALRAVYNVWTLSTASAVRALVKLSYSCRMDSVSKNVSGEGLIVLFCLCLKFLSI